MSKRSSKDMIVTKNKNKVLSCSTPEHHAESPSRDSDSICDSEAASPVPFFCTQDGAEGETDVVWNYYTPKSEHSASSRLKNTTPVSRRSKKAVRPKLIEKPIPKRKTVRPSQKKIELFQDLVELNRNLHELIGKNSKKPCIPDKQSGSEDDIFSDSPDQSPKSVPKGSSRCLRKNVLSSNFTKTDTDTALESDDSMNECLLKASQVVEEKILNKGPPPAKRVCMETRKSIKNMGLDFNFEMDHDSMDAILNSIKLDSPILSKVKKIDSPRLNNDSFDSLVGNLNDSVLDRLTQMPMGTEKSRSNRKDNVSNETDWTIKELVMHEASPLSKSMFGRHNSMPISPVVDNNQPSTSGMAFARYNSMPHEKNVENVEGLGDSPIRCTPDEIKKKHQQAREKLLAKRLLPFTSQQSIEPSQQIEVKKTKFVPKVSSTVTSKTNIVAANNNTANIRLLVEKKRQEALMKLRRRMPQNKLH